MFDKKISKHIVYGYKKVQILEKKLVINYRQQTSDGFWYDGRRDLSQSLSFYVADNRPLKLSNSK